ncbi:Gfo/Idh/MocA family protein [Paenibacillus cymbidii]|uniref:Gfo/Idh/MocA family protein n=1 Tax=Paenibacillus cymbidii TaxID=1639034 RepID=UPI00143685EE|nr:Gfo/Idh/MocA family oxidoreductase [Paenibacillus cymbidii]
MGNVRFGIVGCGYFGAGLARVLQRLEHAEVTAVFGGSRATELAAELGCACADTLEALVSREDVDAIVVASPSHLHREPVIAAARHGKHVFCEKPIALTVADCEAMIAACREANVLLMAGHIYYFIPGLAAVREWVREGVIGTPLVAFAERTGWENKQQNVSWKKNNETSGGHLFHHIHEIDLLQAIMGPAQAAATAGGNLAHSGEGFGNEDDVLLVTLQFPGGAVGSMQYGSGFRWGEHAVKINGSEGAIRIDFKKSKVELLKDGRVTEHLLHATPEEDAERASFYVAADGGVAYGGRSSRQASFLETSMEREMAAFRDAVRGLPIPEQAKALFDGTAARSSVATAAAALAALGERRWIAIS